MQMEAIRAEEPPRRVRREAVITLAAVLLAFAAFDDITTDFSPQYLVMLAGLIWFLALAGIRAGYAWRRGDQLTV